MIMPGITKNIFSDYCLCLCLLLIFTGQNSALAQRITNLNTTLIGENIEITYDLIDDKGGQTFDLQFYSSHDNYTSPLINITGEVGEEITPGTNKKAIWEAKKELGGFKGQLFIEIRGIVTPPFVRILSPKTGDKFKPGKNMEILWDTDVTGSLGIDLYWNGSKVSTVTGAASAGKYNWTLGKDITKQSGYYLVFTSGSKAGKTVESLPFTVSGGMPIWAVVAGVAVVGGVVGVVMSGGEEPPVDDPVVNTDIPDPIKPGGN